MQDEERLPSIRDVSDRITKRGDAVDEKIKKLNAELSRYEEQITWSYAGSAYS